MASTRHPRSRTGCWICRLRKKKCDETRPTCHQCLNLRIQCDGYGVAQPTWMRDPAEMKRKKDDIKLQIGKRGRRRKKTQVQQAELDESNSMEDETDQQDGGDNTLGDDISTGTPERLDDNDEVPAGIGDGQPYVFEITDIGIQLLMPFKETTKGCNARAVAILDSPHPSIGCYRCPVKNSFARSAHPMSGYGIFDARTGKPLQEDIRSGVILVATPPLWKPTKTTCSNTRTKEEEIYHDEYDAIIALFTSCSKRQSTFGPSGLSDPSLIPPISLTNIYELNLVEHYFRNVFRSTYSAMSESRIHDSLREVVVPLLCNNPGLLKGCVSSSAMHLAMAAGQSKPSVKALLVEAWQLRAECVKDLKRRLTDEGASEQTLASILTLTSFEALTPFPKWEPHLRAAIECFAQLDFLNRPTHTAITKFLMARVIWLDILSALTLGRAPQLWANYREILSRPVHERSYCGLLDMMGCDDTVMFLVSEVMCVEDYKLQTLKDGMISWARGSKRAMELDVRLRDRDLPVAMKLPPSPEPPFSSLPPPSKDESPDDAASFLVSPSPSQSSTMSELQSPVSVTDGDNTTSSYDSSTASPSPTTFTSEDTFAVFKEQILNESDSRIPPELPHDQGMVVKATTAAFRTATRIHLWSIGLGFYPRLSFFQQLLEELIVMIALIPVSLSRVVAWPLLIGGCIAIEEKDREFFAGRCASGYGDTLCGIEKVMREVWRRTDESDQRMGVGCGQEVHWRSVMRDQGMEILLV